MSGGVPRPCLCCYLPSWQCVCPYFHEEPTWVALPFIAKIDHTRPNPFISGEPSA